MKKFALLLIFALTSCQDKAPPSESPSTDKRVVYTTFYPTQYFAQRIIGDFAEVVCPVPPDEDAIFWKPDADAIASYQQADLILLNGAGFAKWVEKVNLPASRVVDTAESFKSEFITYENAVKHQHGEEGEHSHEGLDGHTWVDPVNALIQSAAIRDALLQKWPAEKERFTTGYDALSADLEKLDQSFKETSTKAPLLASHPAYNYIARRYGWNLRNLDLDPEVMPDAAAFATIKSLLDTHPARAILWESQPTPEIIARLQSELGLESHVFSPCELAPDSGDYLSVMKENIGNFKAALQ